MNPILSYSANLSRGSGKFVYTGSVMRFVLLFSLFLAAVSVNAGTYQRVDGHRVQLKNVDGTPHKRQGHVGPGGNLRWADLRNASLRHGNMCFADLRNANLEKVDLCAADLHGCSLGGASLTGANLKDAHLGGAELDGADLRGVTNWQSADWRKAYYTEGTEPQWPDGMDAKKKGILRKNLPLGTKE